jgi:hypothetical protein
MGLELLVFGIGKTNIGKHIAAAFSERHATSFFSRSTSVLEFPPHFKQIWINELQPYSDQSILASRTGAFIALADFHVSGIPET